MLGDVVKLVEPKIAVVSTWLRSEILEHWNEKRESSSLSLNPQEEVWKEFWLHASDSHNWCPRRSALKALHGASIEGGVIDAETMWLFALGHVYHDVIQQKALCSVGGGVLLGSWERYVEGKDDDGNVIYRLETAYGKQQIDNPDVVRGWQERPKGDGWKYVEPKVRIASHRIVVKVDGILRNGDVEEVLEIKTVDQMEASSLNPFLGGSPKPNHVLQTQLGMAATGLKRGRIVYVLKGVRRLADAVLEHVIERDERMIADAIRLADECVDAVQFVDNARGNGRSDEDIEAEMDHRFVRIAACPMKSKGRAKYCDVRDLCFPAKKKKE